MKKKRYLLIFLLVLLVTLFTTSTNVFAENEWMQYGNTVTCGNIKNIPMRIPTIVSSLINVLNVAVPVILVIFGAIDFAKSMISGKEDDIKKGRQTFIRRTITGGCIFLIVVVVKFFVSAVDENQDNQTNMISCINCFISGECDGVKTTTPSTPADNV